MYGAMRWIAGCMVVVGLLAAGPTARAQTATKIGVFDPQRVAQECAQGKRLQAKLTEMQQQKQTELSGRTQELADLEKQFAEQALSLSENRRNAMQIDIERRKLELENARGLATQQLQLEFAGAQGRFNEMLLRAVEEFGRREGFDLILDTGAVAWTSAKIDVTTAIIDLVDQMYPLGDDANGDD